LAAPSALRAQAQYRQTLRRAAKDDFVADAHDEGVMRPVEEDAAVIHLAANHELRTLAHERAPQPKALAGRGEGLAHDELQALRGQGQDAPTRRMLRRRRAGSRANPEPARLVLLDVAIEL